MLGWLRDPTKHLLSLCSKKIVKRLNTSIALQNLGLKKVKEENYAQKELDSFLEGSSHLKI